LADRALSSIGNAELTRQRHETDAHGRRPRSRAGAVAGQFRQVKNNRQERFMSSVGFHESSDDLSEQTKDMHRAIVSLMEELEAVDWYNQRADASKDQQLKAILEHNRDEEKEHASMLLEWIRRTDPSFSTQLKKYLFTEKPISDK
jgi:uncharacterized protein